MIFSENRFPPRIKCGAGFFGIMRGQSGTRLEGVSLAARLRRRSTGVPAACAWASVANVAEDAWATVPSLRRMT
jgi:hypothetical protein